MASINIGKVVVGGLAGGLVANVIDFVTNTYVLAADWESFAKAHNLDPAAMSSASVATTWVIVDFLMGIILVFAYAAIRPRFGPGPKTAVISGLLIFVAVSLVLYGFANMGLMTMNMFFTGSIGAIVSTLASSLVGAAIYKE
jgi:hypothetical protein